jgi:hypothetical protein
MRQVAPDADKQTLLKGQWISSKFDPDEYAENEDVICVKEIELDPEDRQQYLYYVAQHQDGDQFFESLHRVIE